MLTKLMKNERIERHSHKTILPEIGARGEGDLAEGKVLVIGARGMGLSTAFYLATAIGKIGILDRDDVEISNLERQILYSTNEISCRKVNSAKERLEAPNPEIEVVPHSVRLTSENIMDTLVDYDIVVYGSDNFATLYLVDDACVLSGKPFVTGGVIGFETQGTIIPKEDTSYRCIFPKPPSLGFAPSCREGGVIGSVLATEVTKLILGEGDLLTDQPLLCNIFTVDFRKINLRRNPKSPLCGDNPTITQPINYEESCLMPRDGAG